MLSLAVLPLLFFLKSKWFWVQLTALILSVFTASNFFSFSKGNQSDAENYIHITTYNLHGFKGFKEDLKPAETAAGIIQFLAENNSDIICLQEFRSWSGDLYQDIHFMKNQTGHVYHHFEYYWKKGGVKSDAFLILSRFPIENASPIIASSKRNIGVLANLRINNELNIRVLNMHLLSFGLRKDEIEMFSEAANMEMGKIRTHGKNVVSKLSNRFKTRQEEFKSLEEELQISQNATILTGDFNETPASYAYRAIRKAGLIDAHKESGKFFGTTYAGNLPLLRIDYIFYSNDFISKHTSVHQVGWSDHYPVTTSLELNQKIR
jgi:endonuclease/exonuclease/phosphatase family metal-dependent hydrolase